MQHAFLKPQEIGINWGSHFRQDRYAAGFEHGLNGGRIDRVEHLRLSFRAGFRAAMLYAREQRRRQGVLDFPQRRKFRLGTVW